MPTQHDLEVGAHVAWLFAALTACVAGFRWLRRRRRLRVRGRLPPRPEKVPLASFAAWQGGLVLALAWCTLTHRYSPESIGVSSTVSPVTALLTGVGEFYVYKELLQLVVPALGMQRFFGRGVEGIARVIPKGRLAYAIALFLCVFVAPIAQALVYRALLVQQTMVIGVAPALAQLLGIGTSVLQFSYLGKRGIATGILAYVASVALLFSPVGLLGTLGFHYANAADSFLGYGPRLRAYRDYRRAYRKYLVARRLNQAQHGSPPLVKP
jgi:hypothetical protein